MTKKGDVNKPLFDYQREFDKLERRFYSADSPYKLKQIQAQSIALADRAKLDGNETGEPGLYEFAAISLVNASKCAEKLGDYRGAFRLTREMKDITDLLDGSEVNGKKYLNQKYLKGVRREIKKARRRLSFEYSILLFLISLLFLSPIITGNAIFNGNIETNITGIIFFISSLISFSLVFYRKRLSRY